MPALKKHQKIKWQCRRGMLELDLLLMPFVNNELTRLSDQQLHNFEALLTTEDPILYNWLIGHESPTNKEYVDLVELIKLYHNIL